MSEQHDDRPSMDPRSTLSRFDAYLVQHRLRFDAVVVGGTALILLGTVSRPTTDVDVLVMPSFDASFRAAILNFALEEAQEGRPLAEDWINNHIAGLEEDLPDGWRQRLRPLYQGEAVSLQTLGRSDFLKIKLFAYCERDFDREDCLAMRPTARELVEARSWIEEQVKGDEWRRQVHTALADIGRELGHGRGL